MAEEREKRGMKQRRRRPASWKASFLEAERERASTAPLTTTAEERRQQQQGYFQALREWYPPRSHHHGSSERVGNEGAHCSSHCSSLFPCPDLEHNIPLYPGVEGRAAQDENSFHSMRRYVYPSEEWDTSVSDEDGLAL